MAINPLPEIHPFCDVCGIELSDKEIEEAEKYENYEFPICGGCIKETIEKIDFVINFYGEK